MILVSKKKTKQKKQNKKKTTKKQQKTKNKRSRVTSFLKKDHVRLASRKKDHVRLASRKKDHVRLVSKRRSRSPKYLWSIIIWNKNSKTKFILMYRLIHFNIYIYIYNYVCVCACAFADLKSDTLYIYTKFKFICESIKFNILTFFPLDQQYIYIYIYIIIIMSCR